MHCSAHKLHLFFINLLVQLFIFGLKDFCLEARGEIGRHKGLKFNLSALGENLDVEPGKFGESLTANTEPRHSRNVRCRD